MRDKIPIFLLSIAIIGFQLAIINLLSYSQWHHFAYLAVSIAMLGFGSSGVILSVWQKFFYRNAHVLMPWLFLACGVFMFISPILINTSWFRFDTFLLFTSANHLLKLVFTCFILFIPFVTGATALGLFFIVNKQYISKLYAWNLAGSALGGVILVLLSNLLFPMNLASIFGFGALGGCSLLLVNRKIFITTLLTSIFGLFILLNQPTIPKTSQFKSLSKTMLIPDAKIVMQKPAIQGTVELVRSMSLRQANGLSLNYTGSIPVVDMAFLNAQAYFAFEKGGVDSTFYTMNLFALPYFLNSNSNKDVLLLQPNSTFYPTQAALLGYNPTIVEPAKTIADSITQFYQELENVVIKNEYSRQVLNTMNQTWQLIAFAQVGSSGSAGLNALREEYLFTTNALQKAFQQLNDDGMVVLSSVMDNPARSSLKLITLASESLYRIGLNPTQHIIAARSWNTLIVILRLNRFTEEKIAKSMHFCSELGFDLVHPMQKNQNNTLSDTIFLSISNDEINNPKSKLAAAYSFNLSPPTDNSPFFAQFMKISRIKDYYNWFGLDSIPFLELGYFIIWASLTACIFLAIIAIAFPLMISIRSRKKILWVWVYFSLLGLGYMLIEVSLIQRSILTLGNPITASAVIISVLLCFSAIGCFYSARFNVSKTLPKILIGISLLVFMIAIWGDSFSDSISSLSVWVRVSLLTISVAPMAFFMGMAFPMGMRLLTDSYADQIPVAWGVNGFFSVIAAPLATIVAVEAGFNYVLLVGALLYILCIPFVVSAKRV